MSLLPDDCDAGQNSTILPTNGALMQLVPQGKYNPATVALTKSDSDVVFCLQFLSKTLTCTLHLS